MFGVRAREIKKESKDLGMEEVLLSGLFDWKCESAHRPFWGPIRWRVKANLKAVAPNSLSAATGQIFFRDTSTRTEVKRSLQLLIQFWAVQSAARDRRVDILQTGQVHHQNYENKDAI